MTEWNTHELIATDPPSVAATTYGAVLGVERLIQERGAHD
jgi:hypothetical protein